MMRLSHARYIFSVGLLVGGSVSQGWVSPARAQNAAAPVSVAPVVKRDLPIYANGIGTVAADQLAQVRALVNGNIDKIGFTEGADVKQGDFLMEIDPRPYQAVLDQAVAKKASDQATLTNAQLVLKRYATMQVGRDIPAQTVDAQKAAVAQAQATVVGDQAAIDAAKLNLQYTRITAPISGRVGLRLVDLGNFVQTTDTSPVVTVAAIHPISVTFTLPQDQMSAVAPLLGASPAAEVQALSADGKNLLATGHLVTADNQIDTTTGTIKLKATFSNQDNHLWPGQFVNARLLVSTEKQALTIPSAAVQRSPDGLFVYVIGADNKAGVKQVTMGPDDGTNAVVTKGVNEGDRVVINGASRLSDGAAVSVRAN